MLDYPKNKIKEWIVFNPLTRILYMLKYICEVYDCHLWSQSQWNTAILQHSLICQQKLSLILLISTDLNKTSK